MLLSAEQTRQSQALRYTVGVLSAAAVVILRYTIEAELPSVSPYFTSILAVMATAWLAGLGPALVTTFLCGLAGIFLFTDPAELILSDPGHQLKFGAFLVESFVISMLVSSLFDSRRKARESEMILSESEHQFRTMVNSIPQMAWIADSKGWIFWFNQRWYDYTGTQLFDVEGWGWEKVVHRDHVERVVKGMQHSWVTGEPFEDTFPVLGKNGEWRWFLTRARPIRDAHGRVVKWFGTNTDINENLIAEAELKKARDEAEAANRSKSQFLANMSHEIRTPMNAILGFSELLSEPHLSEEMKNDHLARVRTNGEHLLALIDDILDLSKVEAGEITTETQKFSVSALVCEILDGMSILAERKQLRLKVEFESEVPAQIKADPVRFRQVVTNLLSNAIKFTESGEVRVHLRCLGQDKLNTRIQVAVEDTGIGIPKEAKDMLFRPFSQADSSVTRRYGGTGLGLSLSKHLAQVMGGSLELERSEVGRGTRFVFELPVGDTTDVPYIRSIPDAPLSGEPTVRKREIAAAGRHVLLAEDSPDLEALMKFYLDKEGLHIDVAHNGLEAVNMAKAKNYDVILMDVQMPLLDGLEATRRLRGAGYEMPIVALTAHALPEDVNKSLEAGCDAHLSKPVDRKELLSCLRRYLSGEPVGSKPAPLPSELNL